MSGQWAKVCRFERGGSEGGATFWFVRLPDGYLVDCGFGPGSEDRAKKLAMAVNDSFVSDDGGPS